MADEEWGGQGGGHNFHIIIVTHSSKVCHFSHTPSARLIRTNTIYNRLWTRVTVRVWLTRSEGGGWGGGGATILIIGRMAKSVTIHTYSTRFIWSIRHLHWTLNARNDFKQQRAVKHLIYAHRGYHTHTEWLRCINMEEYSVNSVTMLFNCGPSLDHTHTRAHTQTELASSPDKPTLGLFRCGIQSGSWRSHKTNSRIRSEHTRRDILLHQPPQAYKQGCGKRSGSDGPKPQTTRERRGSRHAVPIDKHINPNYNY